MPNNELSGMIENFISFLIPENDKLLPIVKNHLSEVEAQSLNIYKDIHRSKALIHSLVSNSKKSKYTNGFSYHKTVFKC